jgi:hypothetical protein
MASAAAAAAVPAAFADSGMIRTYRQYREALQGGDLEALFRSRTGS